MSVDVEEIKAANPIEGVIAEDTTLEQKRGRYLRGIEHDSLVVHTEKQYYIWHHENEAGDVFTWLEKRRRMDFKAAVTFLCRRGGLPEPQWSAEGTARVAAARLVSDALTVACRWWVLRLRASEAALDYCRGRGWTDETIREAGLGYVDGDRKALQGELEVHGIDVKSPGAKAVLMALKGSLVYPCVRSKRVVYFACRLISSKDKKKDKALHHWNPPVDLVGDRRPFFNHEWAPMAEMVVVVEGQADAVTLGQWGMAAVALAGTFAGEGLLLLLKGHKRVVVGLDEGAMVGKGQDAVPARTAICNGLGPLTRVVEWPAKDPNDWLQAGGTAEECVGLIDGAATWGEVVAREVGLRKGLQRDKGLRAAMPLLARMGEMDLALHRPGLVESLGVDLRQFNALIKAAKGEMATAGNGDGGGSLYIVETAGTLVHDHLLEMIVVPPEDERSAESATGWRTRFACRFPDGQVREIPYLDLNNVRYQPLPATDRLLTERVVMFPAALGERMPARELVGRIQGVIRKYVDVDRFYEGLAAYYVLFTWLYDCFNTVPYLRMLGDTGTGKSRFVQVVGSMCFRPIQITGASTTSPIFRTMDRFRGTLVADEFDQRSSDEKSDIIKIFNSGNQRMGGVVLRSVDRGKGFETEVFVVFCPKIIATRQRFEDRAMESRCLTHETGGPTTRMDIPIDMPRRFWTEETMPIRNALLRYRMEFWQPEIEPDYAAMDLSVEKRLNQVTVALLTLIDDEDLRAGLRAFIQEYNRQMVVERGMTLTAKVLEGVCGCWFGDLYSGQPAVMTIGRIGKAVNILMDKENEESMVDSHPAGGAGGDRQDDKRRDEGKRVTARRVGQVVRTELHLRTERSSEHGRARVVVWDAERIEALRKRMGVDEDVLMGVIEDLAPLRETAANEQLALNIDDPQGTG